MEDYIWILIAGAFIFSDVIRKLRKPKGGDDASAEESAGEESSTAPQPRSAREIIEEMLGKEFTREAWPKMEQPTQGSTPAGPTSQPARVPAQRPAQPAAAPQPAPRPTMRPAAMHAATPQSSLKHIAPAEKPMSSTVQLTDATEESMSATIDAQDIRDSFDLRRAVVYSEILRPKFEE